MANDDFKLWEMKKELGLDKWKNISRDVNNFNFGSAGINMKEIGGIGRAYANSRLSRPISEMGGIGEILEKLICQFLVFRNYL